jgi:hypothetical protein
MARPTIFILLRVLFTAGTCLPSSCLATIWGIHIQTHRQTGWIYEVCHWVGLRCYDMQYTSSFIKTGSGTQNLRGWYTYRQQGDFISQLLLFHSKEIRLKLCGITTDSILTNIGTGVLTKFKWYIFFSLYGSTALRTLAVLSVSWSYTQSVVLLGRGISPSQGRYLHMEQHKHRINAHRHPCLEWDSKPRLQCSSGRRLFVP